MQQTTVLILFGGESPEHEVSVASARNIYAAIDTSKFDVMLGYIDEAGRWWLLHEISEEISTKLAEQIVPVLGAGKFETHKTKRDVTPDVILPILHGKNGEDGSVQALGQLLHIPVVGCDMTASAICMDKLATKEILSSHDIMVVPYAVHYGAQPVPNFQALRQRLGGTLFVKPSRAGSSVGVSKVASETDLKRALELAHRHDRVALIEKAISARELEVAVLSNPPTHRISGVGEIRPESDFYSYDAKYAASSAATVDVPALLSPNDTKTIRELAGKVYQLLGCRGLARIDFFMDETGAIYVNEVNTLPGFTDISMYPKLWQHEGMTYPKLIETLINTALDDTMAVE